MQRLASDERVDWLGQRYASAARLTGPRIAVELPGVVDGYWVDDSLFFFLSETLDPKLGTVIDVPTLADVRTGEVEPVLPLSDLYELLAESTGQPFDTSALSSADMPNSRTLAVSTASHHVLIDRHTRQVTRIAVAEQAQSLYSPDQRNVCFIRDHDVWLKEASTGNCRPLTTDGAEHRAYGQLSQTALSAVSYRQQPYPVGLWSPDAQWLLTHRIDEAELPELPLVQHCPPGGGRPTLHRYKYPFPGEPLPRATMVAIHVATGRVVSCDEWPMLVMLFSPFFIHQAWFSGDHTCWFLRFERYCQRVELIRVDLQQGTASCVLSEAVASGYIDVHPMMARTPNVRTLTSTDEIIWFSERDGWGHLYLYDALTGELKNQMTRGPWLVRDIVHVDEERRRVLFLAGGMKSGRDPARRALCAINFDGSGLHVLIEGNGDIFVPRTEPCGMDQDRPFRPCYARTGVAPSGRHAVVQFTSVERGNRTEIVDLMTRRAIGIVSVTPARGRGACRTFTVPAADGKGHLHGVLFFPSHFDDRQQYPLVDYIYPGPHVAHQPQAYATMDSGHAAALAELGFITMMLDTRGMPLANREQNQAGYGSLVEPQLADHAAAVRHLCRYRSYLDAQRVGMIGYSSGGLATVRALCDYGDVFKVGVAACGNYDSMLYTASWSEKYCGKQPVPAQAATAVAQQMNGKLLLMSGDMDENVHVSQTFALVSALIRANKDFELLIVPNEGHSVLTTSGYAQRRAWDFFVRHLLAAVPPANFLLHFETRELGRFWTKWLREVRQ
jgi:dipeptidyl-peptidase-4